MYADEKSILEYHDIFYIRFLNLILRLKFAKERLDVIVFVGEYKRKSLNY